MTLGITFSISRSALRAKYGIDWKTVGEAPITDLKIKTILLQAIMGTAVKFFFCM